MAERRLTILDLNQIDRASAADGITATEKAARLRLIRSQGIGSATYQALLQRYGSAETAVKYLPNLARKPRRAKPITIATREQIERELAQIKEYGARLLCLGETNFPQNLAALEVPPPLITVKGAIEILKRPMLAVVGARNASALGQRFAREIAIALGDAGIVVVSGLARGIDTAAHIGSLKTGTAAVMAGGIDVVYPPENKALYDSIAKSGVIVSEVAFAQQPTAQHFPRRNRIISGLSQGVLVVEATLNSGSLITARIAGEQGRDVYAVPGSPLDPRARGTNSLLRQGAILTETIDDILQNFQLASLPIQTAYQPRLPLVDPDADTSGFQKDILNILTHSPIETDELIRHLNAAPAEVQAALLDLEFDGQIHRHAGQKFSKSFSQ